MSLSINELFEMLNWNSSEEQQKLGRMEAAKVHYISIFFQPKETKNVWENCAKVIANRSDDELSIYLIDMFLWLQDFNWPGADIIYDRICRMQPQFMLGALMHCLKTAIQTEDIPWILCLRDAAKDSGTLELLPEGLRTELQNYKLK